jgi:hypothetical protein
MIRTLSKHLQDVEVLETRMADGLQIFGLRWNIPGGTPYLTLDEALADGQIEISEISQSGSVPLLKVSNRAEVPVFLMAGEQLVGAKQNRILNSSLMVDSRCELTVPVSCVEAGRWGYSSSKFASGGTLSHGKLRKLLSEHTEESYFQTGWPKSKQGEVWQEVSRKLGAMGSVSPSVALQQAYLDQQSALRDLLGSLNIASDWFGVAFLLNGQVAGVDLFDRSATLTKLWPKVSRGYAIDFLEKPKVPSEPLTAQHLTTWLCSAAEGTLQSFKSPGLGHDVRIKAKGIIGSILAVDDRPVHAELFAA